MKIRVAEIQDVAQLAQLHWSSSLVQPGGFLYKLGESFLRAYYRILLSENTGWYFALKILLAGSWDLLQAHSSLKNT